MPQSKIAVQLYSVRNECARDLEGTLAAVAEMGYDGVEFAGFYDRSAAEVKAMLTKHGLEIAGAHVGMDLFAPTAIDKTIAFHRALDNTFLIVPWLGESYRGGRDIWLQTSAEFTRIADALAPHAMRTGYHNHNFEFSPLPDSPAETAWDIVARNTPSQFVLQLDTGNALEGGAQPSEYLARYPGRAGTIHLKEFPDGLPGDGAVRWDDIFALLRAQDATEWVIVEQEGDKYARLEYIDLWLQKLRSLPAFAR